MPTDNPSTPPEAVATDAGEDLTAAGVISDPQHDAMPGGGGLMGQQSASGSATPANPAAPAVAGDAESLQAQAEVDQTASSPDAPHTTPQ